MENVELERPTLKISFVEENSKFYQHQLLAFNMPNELSGVIGITVEESLIFIFGMLQAYEQMKVWSPSHTLKMH